MADFKFVICLCVFFACMHDKFVNYVLLEQDFLGYLDSWEKDVNAREGFTADEKKRMLLSQETIEGLQITGKIYH